MSIDTSLSHLQYQLAMLGGLAVIAFVVILLAIAAVHVVCDSQEQHEEPHRDM